MSLLYELDDVARTYRVGSSDVRAVDGVSLRIDSGEFLAIEGASGSGKSTMLQLLGALDRPTRGALHFEDRDLGRLSESERTALRRDAIGFVFQHFNLIPTLTAAENVAVAMASTKTPRAEVKERALTLLDRVGLSERSEHLPSLLSGGEQQRVAIARAMANTPRVLLADEPTGNLDSRTSVEVVDLLGELVAQQGVTVILVTHAEDVAQRAARRVSMRDGKVLSDRSAASAS
jgi:putative ABC transport system ATP-binding protein